MGSCGEWENARGLFVTGRLQVALHDAEFWCMNTCAPLKSGSRGSCPCVPQVLRLAVVLCCVAFQSSCADHQAIMGLLWQCWWGCASSCSPAVAAAWLGPHFVTCPAGMFEGAWVVCSTVEDRISAGVYWCCLLVLLPGTCCKTWYLATYVQQHPCMAGA